MIKMAVRLGGRTLETYNFSDQEIKIGRDSAGDIFLDNPAISRHHCTISINDGKLTLKDEGSANGTYLNETQISSEMELNNGDTISVGKFQIVVGYTNPNKKEPILNYGGGTLAIDSSTVQSLKDAEKAAEARQKEEPKVLKDATPKTTAAQKIKKESSAPKPAPSPTGAQVFTKNMVQQKSAALAIVISLLVGAAIGFVVGLMVAKNMNANTPINVGEFNISE